MSKQFTYSSPQPVAVASGIRALVVRIELNPETPNATAIMVQFDTNGDRITGSEVNIDFIPSDALLDLLSQECCDQLVAKATDSGQPLVGAVEAVPVKVAVVDVSVK